MIHQRLRSLGFVTVCSFFIAMLVACAGGYPKLVSLSIAPSTATAQDSTHGQVQFVATGTYSDGTVVTPQPALWGFHAPWIEIPDPAGVTVDDKGLAQCVTYKGTTPIVAIAPVNPSTPPGSMNISTPSITATAHLACP